MALDLTLLTTRAECDDALADLQAELDGYQHRTSNLDFAATQSERSTADVAARLAGVQAEIDSYTAMLNTPNMPAALRKQTESKLRRANDRKDNLTERNSTRTGPAAFLASVDSEQLAAQVATLTSAQAAVTTHRATLPA
jgi:chromosome segregation ATPase